MVHKYLLLLVIALSACTRPEVSGLSDPGSAATISRVFVATQRRPDQFGDSFGLTRSARMNYATFDISIPDEQAENIQTVGHAVEYLEAQVK